MKGAPHIVSMPTLKDYGWTLVDSPLGSYLLSSECHAKIEAFIHDLEEEQVIQLGENKQGIPCLRTVLKERKIVRFEVHASEEGTQCPACDLGRHRACTCGKRTRKPPNLQQKLDRIKPQRDMKELARDSQAELSDRRDP